MHDADEGLTTPITEATLRELRESLGLTQSQVAERLHTHQTDVSRIERSQGIMLSTLCRYAEALGARCEVVFLSREGRRIRVLGPA
jgi:transcriptional regulator with XRE-family HTH domain